MQSIITLADSYKFSHFNQYPEGTEKVHCYLAPRGGIFSQVFFFGLSYYLKKYLAKPVTPTNVFFAKKQAEAHGIPFNEEGWTYIVEHHQGKLPLEIKALPEGTVVGNKDALLTIENTDPKCAWLVGYTETLILKIWYPTTVASKALAVKAMLKKFWEQTCDSLAGLDFAYHNFGDRGSTSVEAAALGGVAHLTQFKGTDNFNALNLNKEFYGNQYPAFSIPASEHSTTCSWGKENEFDFYKSYLETYKSSPIIACVMDSYNIYESVDFVTSGEMKDKIESSDYPRFIIRPDSGDPIEVLEKLCDILLKNKVAYTVNDKGYVVFNKYGFIWGDGVTLEAIESILDYFCNVYQVGEERLRLSAENFAFGSGGDLMQNVNRDTLKMAMKCSAILVNGEWRDVFKEPVTDLGKASIKGRVIDPRFKTVFKDGVVFEDREVASA